MTATAPQKNQAGTGIDASVPMRSSRMPFSANAITQGWISFFRVLASNTGIQFVFGQNQQAATDGKRVFLPSLPANLTDDDLDLTKALGFHEVGHIQFSDVAFFQDFAVKHGDFARFLLNALDDVFMEYKQARSTREAERYFRRKATILYQREHFRDGSNSAAEAVACYALSYLRKDRWSEYRDPHAVIVGNFNRHFGAHSDIVRSKLDDVLTSEFPSVQSTQDAGSLTLRIIAMLKGLADEEEQKNGSGSMDTQESGQPQSGGNQLNGQEQQGTGADLDQPGGHQPGEGQGASSGGENGESTSQQGNAAGTSGGAGDAQPLGGAAEAANAQTGGNGDQHDDSGAASGRSLKQIVDEVINAEGLGDKEVFDDRQAVTVVSKAVQAGNHPDYKGQALVPGFVIDGKLDGPAGVNGRGSGVGSNETIDGMSVTPMDAHEADEMKKRLGQKARVLASKLQALLMQQEDADSFTSIRGQLGQGHLYRLPLGDTRLFTQTEEAERPTTALSFVVDLSSSTQDQADKDFAADKEHQLEASKTPSTLRSILESVVLLETVFDQIGCPREVLGFAPKGGELMSVARTFSDSMQTALNRIGGLRKIAGGGHTPIGEAVFHAGRRLMSHGANRKVMFVLTDGAPSDIDKATAMTRFCESGGIRVVYLIIGEKVRTDWLTEENFPFAVATSSTDVAPVLLAQARELLL
ncbi:VWA domain-containing protein [Pseudomonas guariconensis]|uniref:VWA domain-containing protein n=1 Tax=Pseudomonas guariconensis TaxID=1288410 RepID=UPI003905CC8C